MPGADRSEMRKAIIHIGMHKTGTTAIQHALSGFGDDRIAMSGLSSNGHNEALLALFGDPAPATLPQIGPAGLPDGALAALEELLARDLAAVGRSILWSAEMLSHPSQSRQLAERMIARLRPHFDRIEVVAYVRAPGPFLTAALQERLRMGRAPAGWAPMWVAYPRRFARWEELADQIHYRAYEPATFAQGDVVRDFCALLGIAGPPGGVVNASDGLSQVALHYVQRRFGLDLIADPGHAAARGRLWRHVSRLPHVPFRIAPARLQELMAQHGDDLDWMRQRLPELDMAQGLSPRSDSAEIREPEDLCALAIGLEAPLMALSGLSAPGGQSADQGDALRRIAAHLTAVALEDGGDQSGLRERIARLVQAAGPAAEGQALVAAALDLGFYRRRAGRDFADAGAAAAHYLGQGWQAGLDPAPWFSAQDYARDNPDVTAAGIAPFLHFIRHGAAEGRAFWPSRHAGGAARP